METSVIPNLVVKDHVGTAGNRFPEFPMERKFFIRSRFIDFLPFLSSYTGYILIRFIECFNFYYCQSFISLSTYINFVIKNITIVRTVGNSEKYFIGRWYRTLLLTD